MRLVHRPKTIPILRLIYHRGGHCALSRYKGAILHEGASSRVCRNWDVLSSNEECVLKRSYPELRLLRSCAVIVPLQNRYQVESYCSPSSLSQLEFVIPSRVVDHKVDQYTPTCRRSPLENRSRCS